MADRPDKSKAQRWAPVWTFACRKARECVRLTAANRELRQALAVTRAELAAHKAHWGLAIAQRDAARDLFAAVVGEAEPAPAWVDEAEAWANGARPA